MKLTKAEQKFIDYILNNFELTEAEREAATRYYEIREKYGKYDDAHLDKLYDAFYDCNRRKFRYWLKKLDTTEAEFDIYISF